MSERNPPLAVKISLTPQNAEQWRTLLDLLIAATIVKPNFTQYIKGGNIESSLNEITLFPPKHVTNYNFWAERVRRYAQGHNFNALVIRTAVTGD